MQCDVRVTPPKSSYHVLMFLVVTQLLRVLRSKPLVAAGSLGPWGGQQLRQQLQQQLGGWGRLAAAAGELLPVGGGGGVGDGPG